MSELLIAVDWGTTNRRSFLIEDGTILKRHQDSCGAASLTASDYPAAVANLRCRFGNLPVLIAGMAGSNIGWRDVPYVEVPANFDALARGVVHIEHRTLIVPGVVDLRDHRADVMRGEEVLILGAVASGAVPADALVCQPGTHCKWVELNDGQITRFTTAMTGELFALLRGSGLLARQLGGVVQVDAHFRDGVMEGAGRDLAVSLFGIRSSGLLGRRSDTDAASFASGLLIGADVSARLVDYPGTDIQVLAGSGLGNPYRAAIELLGGSTVLVEPDQAFAAGITHIASMTA